MNLKHSFEIPADQETAWGILLDIPRIAPCMPGAELTEVVGERAYKGLARVKVGPVALQFAGAAEITEVDDSAHQAVVRAKGADGKGRGNADATVRFALSPVDGQTTRVDVDTDLSLTGAVAQYGRASGLIDAVAKQIIADFVKNLESELASAKAADHTDLQDEAPSPPASPTVQAAPPTAPTATQTPAPVSGLRLLFRAIAAMIAGWLKPRDSTSTTDKRQ